MKPPRARLLLAPFVLLLCPFTVNAASAPAPLAPQTSAVFKFEDLPVKPTGVGERRDVTDRPTATLQRFECHISTLNPGRPSHPPHVHPQEELIILRDGTLDVHINGREQRVGAGSAFFFASYDSHAVRNTGDQPATYFVFNFATAATATVRTQPAAEYAGPGILGSGVYDWAGLKAEPTKVGERRGLFDGPTVTCRRLESHVTTLNAGEIPHAAHRHPDEEIVLVKEGLVEVTINGVAQRIGPGSIAFFASNDEHGLRNVGDTRASYYIIRVASEATPAATKL